jgi:hypothetical protein
MFWGMHFFTVWAAVYLTFGLNVRPTWRSYRFAVATTAGWAVTVMTFNALTGTNYGYLNRKPAVETLLDLCGPWPAYLVVEIALVAGVWALMTWPWTHAAHPRGSMPARGRSKIHHESSPGFPRGLRGKFMMTEHPVIEDDISDRELDALFLG